tara:strand:+ start:194 stop:694 length:501 start_codon:yes stop_codon:yes gene_type:complete
MADRKLFFALWPSHRQRELLRDTINPVLSAIEGSTVDRRNWHVTLVFIGNFPEQHLPGLWKAMDLIDPGEIRLRFDSLTFWQSPKIACIHAKTTPPELSQLMTKLHQVVAPLGIARKIAFTGPISPFQGRRGPFRKCGWRDRSSCCGRTSNWLSLYRNEAKFSTAL